MTFGIVEASILGAIIYCIYRAITPTKKPVETLPKMDKGDLADAILGMNQATTMPEMDWDYTKVSSLELLKLYKRIEKAKMYVSNHVYKAEGDYYDVFFNFRKEDTEKFKTEILGD